MSRVISFILLLIITSAACSNDDFPGRVTYPLIPYIELEQLYNERDNVIFIDTRSLFEYETLSIKGAILLPLTSRSSAFSKKLNQLRTENPAKKIIFYCNGHSCMKSYKATKRASSYVGLDNVYAFDAGIFDWANKYPNETLLLGEVLGDPTKLISTEKFKSHLMPAEQFIKSATEEVVILDIRDRIEREGFYIFAGHEHSISMDTRERSKLEKLFKKIKASNKTLYVYDMVGKQIRWFQYYIESKGIKNYYFMKGGANEFYKLPIDQWMDS